MTQDEIAQMNRNTAHLLELTERMVRAMERAAIALEKPGPTYVLNSMYGEVPWPRQIVDARAKATRAHDV